MQRPKWCKVYRSMKFDLSSDLIDFQTKLESFTFECNSIIKIMILKSIRFDSNKVMHSVNIIAFSTFICPKENLDSEWNILSVWIEVTWIQIYTLICHMQNKTMKNLYKWVKLHEIHEFIQNGPSIEFKTEWWSDFNNMASNLNSQNIECNSIFIHNTNPLCDPYLFELPSIEHMYGRSELKEYKTENGTNVEKRKNIVKHSTFYFVITICTMRCDAMPS